MDTKKSRRARNFATIIYEESASPTWRQCLADQFVPSFISPLHAPDQDDKKSHYHVLVMYDAPKAVDQARELFSKFGGVGCEVVQSMRGYARYLCHLDEDDKPHYEPDKVTCLCGADYFTAISLPADKYVALSEMEQFCEKYNVVSFYLLSMYAAKHRTDWHRVLCDSGSVYMREFLKSRKWSVEQGYIHIVDQVNGDVIF